ncbi:hypothetical protein H0H92_000117 [Tricholoma furcatifolium]|nr:hypothetical protein H0H92_000117 [Tricholoma furcatifolium]
MKRMATDESPPAKRVKISNEIFDDPQLERLPTDILANGLEDDSGYLSCKCLMAWPPNEKQQAILETIGSTSPIRFDVKFSGACSNFFPEIQLKPQDEFLLALKSAHIEQGNPSRPCTIPLKLVYEEGVVIKFSKRQGPCALVDTWHLQALKSAEDANRASLNPEDSWFFSPRKPPSASDASISPKSHLSPDSPMPHSPLITTVETMAVADQSSVNPRQDSLPPEEPKLTKKEKKRLQKEERALQRLASESAKQMAPEASIDAHSERRIEPSDSEPLVTSVTNTVSTPFTSSPPTSPGAKVTRKTSPGIKFGSTSAVGRGRYHKLAALKDIAASPIFSVIGVVVQAHPVRKTRSGDWSCNLRLIDPSTSEGEDVQNLQGFSINSFTRKYEQWLPRPTIGEVLIMRGLKASSYLGTTSGVGYHGKLQWAIYSPTTGKIHHGDVAGAPESESLVSQNFGEPFSPFYVPVVEEIRHCIKMADWWQDAQKRNPGVAVCQVAGPSNVSPMSSKDRRQHKLISEAGPYIHPSGFFDCTVEVLNCQMNDTGVCSLYVTDYTINNDIPPTQAAWCPPGLADYILKIEAWDDVAQGTSPGEYCSITNAQMRKSSGGYVEGKVNEKSKLRRIDVDEGSVNPRLQALLERKKAWEDANTREGQPSDFVYATISEVEEGKYFHCVVEVLHAIHDGDGTSCIYVTDYTHREALVTGKKWNNWGADLDGRILRIALFNNQVEVAKSVQAGSFYEIKKLRLKHSATSRQFQGQLGGVERLVFLLNPNRSDDKLDALKRQKEEWRKSLMAGDVSSTAVQRVKSEPSEDNQAAEIQLRPRRRGTTIAELQADERYPRKTRG